MKRTYGKANNQTTHKTAQTVRLIFDKAAESALVEVQGRKREIVVSPTRDGWQAMEFTEGGGSWLATRATWEQAVVAAVGFLNQTLRPNLHLEIRLGHFDGFEAQE